MEWAEEEDEEQEYESRGDEERRQDNKPVKDGRKATSGWLFRP